MPGACGRSGWARGWSGDGTAPLSTANFQLPILKGLRGDPPGSLIEQFATAEALVLARQAAVPEISYPDLPVTEPFRSQWLPVPDNETFDNGFKVQWEQFLTCLVDGTRFPYDFLEGAKGVQLAELGLESWRKGCKLDVPALSLDGHAG